MSADPPKTVRGGFLGGSHRALAGTLLLAAVVVLAAGMTSATHFSGPRLLPKVSLPASQKQTKVAPATPVGHPKASPSHFPWWIVGVVLGVIALLVIAYVIWRWLANRRWGHRRGHEALPREQNLELSSHELEPEPDVPLLRSGIQQALDMLDDAREPADAIVRAWLGLQETAEASGILRGPAETPTEFTSRILRGAFADDRAIGTLLRLYLRTRFGDHPVTGEDVAAVREALAELVASWPEPTAPTAPAAPAARPAPTSGGAT